MVTQWGMSDKLGLVAYDSDQPVFMGMEYGHSERTYSQETANAIDNEVRRLIAEAHERATKLLKENRSILDNMSRVLVEKETIYTEEVAMLMKGASYKDVIAEMDGIESERRENPFARVTNPSKEHIVEPTAEDLQQSGETGNADGNSAQENSDSNSGSDTNE
jgi:cell division protease FtsH